MPEQKNKIEHDKLFPKNTPDRINIPRSKVLQISEKMEQNIH